MKCLDKLIILFRSFSHVLVLYSLCIAIIYCFFALPVKSAALNSSQQVSSSPARNSSQQASSNQTQKTNPYWSKLKPKLEQYLKQNLDTQSYSYTILEPEMLDYLGGSADAKVDFSGLVPSSRQEMRTIVASTRTPIEQLRISVKIAAYIDAWIADTDIPAGTKVSNVHMERISVPPNDIQLIIDAKKIPLENIKYKIANYKIKKGDIIKTSSLKSTKLVSAGDQVNMISESELIRLEFKCKAMGAGDIGDEITLSCPDLAKKNPKVIITGPNQATLK